jgi:acrylyl-CoA reductase (NADPH)
MSDTFQALVVRSADSVPAMETLGLDALPMGDVLVDVRFSTLNYKDGLALTSPEKVIRSFPMVPGIDFAGVVVESASPAYTPGDEVVLTGWGVGERHWGGYARRARVNADWLVPLPSGLTLKRAMALGTAGFTAMLAVMALERHGLAPGNRPVAVTGAAGGVGSVAVALLGTLGHHVVAVTGRSAEAAYLKSLGAAEVVGREEVLKAAARPLVAERWAGAVDTAGGDLLAALFPAMAANASVAACGLAAGAAFHTTVLPFILRGVNLLGINSVTVPGEPRRQAWARLAAILPGATLDAMSRTIPLSAVLGEAPEILAGRTRGRTVVDVTT